MDVKKVSFRFQLRSFDRLVSKNPEITDWWEKFEILDSLLYLKTQRSVFLIFVLRSWNYHLEDDGILRRRGSKRFWWIQKPENREEFWNPLWFFCLYLGGDCYSLYQIISSVISLVDHWYNRLFLSRFLIQFKIISFFFTSFPGSWYWIES